MPNVLILLSRLLNFQSSDLPAQFLKHKIFHGNTKCIVLVLLPKLRNFNCSNLPLQLLNQKMFNENTKRIVMVLLPNYLIVLIYYHNSKAEVS